MTDRIFFKNNPWPEGHPVNEFIWEAELRKDQVWFHFHLATENYYSEREIEDNEEKEYESDWEAPIVWGNYHSCKMSTSEWHKGGFYVCSQKEFSETKLDGLELEIDNDPENIKDWDDLAFHIYLLGHDAVARHKIKFVRAEDSLFEIQWSGKIAQAYVGDYEFKHDFNTVLKSVQFPKLQ